MWKLPRSHINYFFYPKKKWRRSRKCHGNLIRNVKRSSISNYPFMNWKVQFDVELNPFAMHEIVWRVFSKATNSWSSGRSIAVHIWPYKTIGKVCLVHLSLPCVYCRSTIGHKSFKWPNFLGEKCLKSGPKILKKIGKNNMNVSNKLLNIEKNSWKL